MATAFLLLQVFFYWNFWQHAPAIYPILSFFCMAIFLMCMGVYGKCLFAVRMNRFGVDTLVFYTNKKKEAKAVVRAVNETLRNLVE